MRKKLWQTEGLSILVQGLFVWEFNELLLDSSGMRRILCPGLLIDGYLFPPSVSPRWGRALGGHVHRHHSETFTRLFLFSLYWDDTRMNFANRSADRKSINRTASLICGISRSFGEILEVCASAFQPSVMPIRSLFVSTDTSPHRTPALERQ